MNQAEKWLDAHRKGLHEHAYIPDVDSIPFPDGSEIRWNGADWFVAFTERVTIDKPIAEGTIRVDRKEISDDAMKKFGQAIKDAYQLGNKTDKYKPRWSLLPVGTVNEVIKVLEFGAEKYSVGDWVHVPDARTRYYDATMRHLEAWFGGEKDDTESGLPHLAHAICCALFLLWFDKEKRDD